MFGAIPERVKASLRTSVRSGDHICTITKECTKPHHTVTQPNLDAYVGALIAHRADMEMWGCVQSHGFEEEMCFSTLH